MKKFLMVLVVLFLATNMFAVDDEGGGTAVVSPAVVLPSEVTDFTWVYIPGVDAFVAGDLHFFWQTAFGGIPYAITVTATEGDDITVAWDVNGCTLSAITGANSMTITAIASGITVTAVPGNYEWLSLSDPDGGGAALPLAVQPEVEVAAATPTITQTVTITVTQTITQTITQTVTQTITQTITQTVTITVTKTITQTITQTVTQTITPTVTPIISGGFLYDNQQGSGKELIFAGHVKLRAVTLWSAKVDVRGNTIWISDAGTLNDIARSNTDTARAYRYPFYIGQGLEHSVTIFLGEAVQGNVLPFPEFDNGIGVYFDGENLKATYHLNKKMD